MMAATFESTSGRRAGLRDFQGRPAVLFYECRGTEGDNEALKYRLRDLAAREGWDVELLGFVNLRAYNFAPVRPVVRRGVRAIAERFGWELWLDFAGALQGAPYELDGAAANLLVLDERGRGRFRARGPLDAGNEATLLRLLRSFQRRDVLTTSAVA